MPATVWSPCDDGLDPLAGDLPAGDRLNCGKRVMDHVEREQLRRQQVERERPYAYGSDLHHLWAWGYRMQCWLDCDYDRPSRHLGILVYPYREAADALVRFSVKYPAIIRIIQDELDIAVEALEHCEEGPDQAADLGTAMSVLCRRIETGATTIAQAEDELSRTEPSAPSTAAQTKGMSCSEATERLLSLRLQGLPYTSQPLLGKQIGCAASTVNKAIAGSAELRVWMERTTTRRSALRAEAFSGVHQSNLPAPKDGDPSDFLPPEDVEAMSEILVAYQPRLFGALLDLLARYLADRERVHLNDKPRMADFAGVLAVLDQMGLSGPPALPAYLGQQSRIAAEVIDDDLIGAAIVEFIRTNGQFQGTAGDLLDAIKPKEGAEVKKWPKHANGLTGRIKRLIPALREMGILVTIPKERTARGRIVTIERSRDESSPSSQLQ